MNAPGAELELNEVSGDHRPVTGDEAQRVIGTLQHVAERLKDGNCGVKAKIYEELGLRLEYTPDEDVVKAEVAPPAVGGLRVSEGRG